MDVLSLCRAHADLRDVDIQAMFDHYVGCRTTAMERWIAGQEFANVNEEADHNRELREFLSDLLDAAYFELDEGGATLHLRLPAVIEPPPLVPSEGKEVIEVGKPQDPSSPITSKWIREKLLVPRSVAMPHRCPQAQGGRAGRPSRPCSAGRRERKSSKWGNR